MAVDYQYYEFRAFEYLIRLGQLWEGMEELPGVKKILQKLQEEQALIRSRKFRVAVVGEFRRGKTTFINALSGLADITTKLTVPAFAVDMQGAILAVPMAEFGGQSDYIMTIGANFICHKKVVPCRLLLSPDIRSLNFLLKKLGVLDE